MPKLPLKWTRESIAVDCNTFLASENFPMPVLRIKDPAGPPEIMWAGLFDETWQLPKK
jgi:hypothetical protein